MNDDKTPPFGILLEDDEPARPSPPATCENEDCLGYLPPQGRAGSYLAAMECLPAGGFVALHVLYYGEGIQLIDPVRGLFFAGPIGFGYQVTVEPAEGGARLIVRHGEVVGASSVGPAPQIAAAAEALRRITDPGAVRHVNSEELAANPHGYHATLVHTQGVWRRGFEQSTFAGAWLDFARGTEPHPADERSYRGFDDSVVRLEVRGLWLSRPGMVYGHMGGCPAVLIVYDWAEG